MLSKFIVSIIFTICLVAGVIKPTQCDETYEKILKSTRNFAIDFLKATCKDGENTVISPTSVSMMLALLQQGAGGNTADELSKIVGSDAEAARDSYRKLSKMFTVKTPGVTVEWGNKIYPKENLTILEDFRRNVEENFGTTFEELDYVGQSPDVLAEVINTWIKESTHGQIEDLILPHMVNSDALMLLVNVMFFKGTWQYRFREKNTKLEDFEITADNNVTASYMCQRNKFYAGRNATLGVKWIELPLEGNTHKMIFVLPTKRHALKRVMSRLTGDDLENIIKYADVADVRLRLPKFKLKGKYSLPTVLQPLGVRDIFTEASNLSKMSPEPLHVTDAFHEANVEIDEKGTTASAATVVTISRRLLLTETFRFDQPFLFFIVDTANEIPLFAGRVSNPVAS